MRSVAAQDEVGGRTNLVRAAVELVGERGHKAATVRAVAERAGVSAPLVIHHFGSKDGLLAASDAYVKRQMIEAMQTIAATGESEATVKALLAVDDIGPSIAYVGRSLLEGGEVGHWWFDEMLRLTIEGLDGAVAAGAARPSDDPTMRAMLLIAMDLGLILMRPLVEASIGGDLTDPQIVERWVRTEFDVLTNGVLIALPGAPAAPRATEDRR